MSEGREVKITSGTAFIGIWLFIMMIAQCQMSIDVTRMADSMERVAAVVAPQPDTTAARIDSVAFDIDKER